VLGARGYPVPTILWHGMISAHWHVTVQNRLSGRPLDALDGPLLDTALRLVELQADAGIPAGDRDFTGYVANVLFDDWDDEWADAPRASAAAGLLCARLRRWLQPVWGLRLPPADYANNDLNLSNILTDGALITGVVDWVSSGWAAARWIWSHLPSTASAAAITPRQTACWPERPGWLAAAGCAAWSATGRSPRLPISPASARHTAIPSGMKSARRSLPSPTGFRRPAAPDRDGSGHNKCRPSAPTVTCSD
jgi:hypothetical protein